MSIELKQKENVTFGYPYNAPIDVLFQALDDDYIKSNNLTLDELNDISQIKEDLKKTDIMIHNFFLDLSKLENEFDTLKKEELNDQVEELNTYLINIKIKDEKSLEYDKFKIQNQELVNSKKLLTDDLTAVRSLKRELEETVTGLKIDASIDEFIEELHVELDNINTSIINMNENKIALDNNITNHIQDFVEFYKSVDTISKYDETLLEYYTIWESRIKNNTAYIKMIELSQNDYNNIWGNYGKIVEYTNNKNRFKLFDNIMHELIVKKCEIESSIAINMIELDALSSLLNDIHNNTINSSNVLYQKFLYLDRYYKKSILGVDNNIDAQRKILNVYNEHDSRLGYEHYIENVNIYFQKIYQSVLHNETLEIDTLKRTLMIDDDTSYTTFMDIKNSYDYIKNDIQYTALKQLKNDLNSKLGVVSDTIHYLESQHKTLENPIERQKNISMYNNRLEFYTSQEERILEKIDELNKLISSSEYTTSKSLKEYNNSKKVLIGIETKIQSNYDTYKSFIESRIDKFIDTQYDNLYEKINSIKFDNNFKNFKTEIDTIVDIMKNNIGFNDELILLLEKYYNVCNDIFKESLKNEFDKEISHILFENELIHIYEINVNTQFKNLYANIIQIQQTGVSTIENKQNIDNFFSNIYNMVDIITSLSEKYNIEFYILNDIYNYDKKMVCDFKLKNEIILYINNLKNKIDNISLEQERLETQIIKQNKIDLLWYNMEKDNDTIN